MPNNCAVYGCNNLYRNTAGSNVKYFSFPKNPITGQLWISKCRRADKLNTKYARICSDHFTKDDYIDDMKARLLNINSPAKKRLLKEEAVPSLCLYKDVNAGGSKSIKPGERETRAEKRKYRKLACSLMNYSKKTVQPMSAEHEMSVSDDNDYEIGECEDEERIQEYVKEISKLNEKIKVLEITVQELRTENAKLKVVVKEERDTEVEKVIQSLFTKTQIEVLLKNKSVRQWPEEDIACAITLRSLSPKCYKYLRDVKGFPLPCVSTLNNRAIELKCEPGILDAVLSLMKSNSVTLTESERICVLSFDEMSMHKQWSYDKRMDILYKPHDKVQVIMLRGLTRKWKQPVYFDFDDSNVHAILPGLIERIEQAGYHVVAVVHDLGPSNLRTWK